MNKIKRSPGIVNTIGYIFVEIKLMYNSVMTIENSPLKKFDPMVAHMVFQVLALVWSGVFAAMIGSYIAFGISAAFHIFLITGVLVTALAFQTAERKGKIKVYSGRAADGEHI